MSTVLAKPKWIGKSMTIWGSLIAIATTGYQTVGPILDAVGVTVPITPADIEAASNAGSLIITGVGAAAGLIITWIGRFRAGRNVQPITMAPSAESKIVTVVTPPASHSKQTG